MKTPGTRSFLLRDTLELVTDHPILIKRGFERGRRYQVTQRAGSLTRLADGTGADMGWVGDHGTGEGQALKAVWEELVLPEPSPHIDWTELRDEMWAWIQENQPGSEVKPLVLVQKENAA